jgi:hypothetical protein
MSLVQKLAVPLAVVLFAACHDNATEPSRHAPALNPAGISARRVEVTEYPGRGDGFLRGVYYFPGWHPGDFGHYMGVEAPTNDRWPAVQAVPSDAAREPWWGWYDENSVDVASHQILAMQDAGFDFVVYQMGWSYNEWAHQGVDPYGVAHDSVYIGHAIRNHMLSPYHDHLKFAVDWWDVLSDSTHNTSLTSPCSLDYCFWAYKKNVQGWTADTFRASISSLVRYWFNNYIKPNGVENADYYFYGAARRPVIFIGSPQGFLFPNAVFGGSTSPSDMTSLMRSVAAEFGYSGSRTPFFVVTAPVHSYSSSYFGWSYNYASYSSWGYDALSSYVEYPNSPGFTNVLSTYQNTWSNVINESNLTYFVPNLVGLDQRGVTDEWGNPKPDYWSPIPDSVTKLVDASEAFASGHANRTSDGQQPVLMTCCWNEWQEGEVMEPGMLFNAGAYKGSALSDAHRKAVTGLSDQAPAGWFDVISSSGLAEGWAIDPDTPNQPIYVAFFAYNSYGQPGYVYLGEVWTDRQRDDVNSANSVVGTHGFAFQIPPQYQGAPIYVSVINSSGNESMNVGLGGSPRTYPFPLNSVSIDGPDLVAQQSNETWTADVSGGVGTLHYTWLVNGQPVPLNTRPWLSYPTNSSFELSVTVTDSQNNSVSAAKSITVSACYPYDC